MSHFSGPLTIAIALLLLGDLILSLSCNSANDNSIKFVVLDTCSASPMILTSIIIVVALVCHLEAAECVVLV